MSYQIKDGGPAFPSGKIDVGDQWADYPYVGMSLRDYFAAHVFQAVLAARMASNDGDITQEFIAEECYELADALLKQRELPVRDSR
jgi:hypothetical protein